MTGQGPLGRFFAALVGVALLIAGVFFSVVALAVIVVLGLALWAYLWWKTRALRRAMREQAAARPYEGTATVVEGEATVVDAVVADAPLLRGPETPER